MTWKGLGPLSYKGQGRCKISTLPTLQLKVQKYSLEEGSVYGQANPQDIQSSWQQFEQPLFAELESGSDCVVSIRLNEDVKIGCIVLNEEQMYNWRVVEGQTITIKPFIPGQAEDPFSLLEIEAEIRIRENKQDDEEDTIGTDADENNQQHQIIIDCKQFCGYFLKRFFQQVVSVNQLSVISYLNRDFVVRITSTNSLTQDEQEESLTYHCYRGLITAETKMYIMDTNNNTNNNNINNNCVIKNNNNSSTRSPTCLILQNCGDRSKRKFSTNVVDVTTSDDEWFPVKKRLLRPCIKLTDVVRKEEQSSVQIDIDSLNFDRVLRYLESTQSDTREVPNFPGHVLEDLLGAAEELGLGTLQDYCEVKLGKLKSRLRILRLSEINKRNANGECLLIMDGMVLDVTRWLPEHPGGSAIIPAQALDLDSCRFFELYHATRESFLYLKEFYIGEVDPLDRDQVPCPQQASEEFMEQFREYTDFRMAVVVDEKPWKSF